MSMSATEKDSGIRLFGRQIPLPESQIPANSGPMDTCSSTKKTEAEISGIENTEQQENSQDLRDSKQDSQHNVQENEPIVDSKPAEEDTRDEDKLLKKPDKILQCPRCNSLDTKFCYFNNYNVNQPRHFCKNCQRYWTAGGTMRNVPIGAGRRKNKQLPSQYRQIVITSDGIPTSRLETTVSTGHQQISSLDSSAAFRSKADNETVLKFGPDTDTPICESMESMLNLRDQKRGADGNSISCVEYREEPSLCVSSVTNSGTQGNESLSEHNNTSNWLHCYPVPPWVVPWNPNWNNVASTAAVHQSTTPLCPTAMQWCPTPMVAIPGISPPNIPLQVLSAPYWSGAPMLAIGSRACVSPSSSTSTSGCSGNGTPTLGKHTRETSFTDEEKLDKSILVQKIIRIDDPNKASKRVEHNGEGKDLVLGASKTT